MLNAFALTARHARPRRDEATGEWLSSGPTKGKAYAPPGRVTSCQNGNTIIGCSA